MLKIAGLPVYSVETLQYMFNEYRAEGVDIERSDYSIGTTSSKHWITAIR